MSSRSFSPTMSSSFSGFAGPTTTSAVGLVTVTSQLFTMPLWEVTVIVAVPRSTPVTTPLAETETMSSSLLSQVKSVRAL